MNIRLTARSKEGTEEYLPIERHSLHAEILRPASGDPEEMQGIRKAADGLKVALLENLQILLRFLIRKDIPSSNGLAVIQMLQAMLLSMQSTRRKYIQLSSSTVLQAIL